MENNKNSQRKIGVMLSYTSLALSTILSLVYTPILLDKIGQGEYGVYNLVASAASYLTLLSLGFGSAYVRFFSRYYAVGDEKGEAGLNALYFLLYCTMGFLALVLGAILAFNSEVVFKKLSAEEASLAKKLLLILTVNTAISFPLSVFDAIVTAHERFLFQKILIMAKRVLTPCLILVLLLFGYRSMALVFVHLALTVVTGAISVFYVFRTVRAKFDFHNMQFGILREMASYSFFVFVIMITDQICWNLDKFLLGVYRGAIQIAIYGVAAQLNNYFLTFSDIVSNVFTPKIHLMVAEKKSLSDMTDLMIRVGRVQFYIAMLIFMGYVFFGQAFICVWAGSEYKESYLIGLVLFLGATLPLIESVSNELLRALGLHKAYALLVAISAVLNLAISIPLCLWFGALGCAIGTTVSLIFCSWIARNIYMSKKGIEVGRFFKAIGKMLPSLILPIFAGTLIMLFAEMNNYLSIFLYIALFVIVFAGSMWLFAMNDEEKEIVLKPVRRIMRRKEK